MDDTNQRKLYVVRLKGATHSYSSNRSRIEAAFADRSAAAECLARCERAIRPTMRDGDLFWPDPHHSVSPADLTDFDLPVLLDWLQDAGIPLPKAFAQNDWLRWWGEQREQLTEDQLSHLFAGLHRFSLYEIREVGWIDTDGRWSPEEEWSRDTGRPYPEGPADAEEWDWPEPPAGNNPHQALSAPPLGPSRVGGDDDIPF